MPTILEIPAVLRVTRVEGDPNLHYLLDVARDEGATPPFAFTVDADGLFSPQHNRHRFEERWVRSGRLGKLLYASKAGVSHATTGREIRKGVWEKAYRGNCPCGWHGEYRRVSTINQDSIMYRQVQAELSAHLADVHFVPKDTEEE